MLKTAPTLIIKGVDRAENEPYKVSRSYEMGGGGVPSSSSIPPEVRAAYERLGYELVVVPRESLEERVAFIQTYVQRGTSMEPDLTPEKVSLPRRSGMKQ